MLSSLRALSLGSASRLRTELRGGRCDGGIGKELKIKHADYNHIYNHTLAMILVEYASAGFEMIELIVDVQNCLQWSSRQEVRLKKMHVLFLEEMLEFAREAVPEPQDFTGVPAVVDLACMRDAMNKLSGDSSKINPLIMPPMDRRPPLAVSPRRLRSRRNLCSVPSDQTPPASTRTKPKTPVRSSLPCGKLLRLGYSLISSELMEMAKRAKDEFSGGELEDLGTGVNASVSFKTSPLFERGRFYEVYSARRNERLKRKQMEFEGDETVVQDPGIAVELAKRRAAKKAGSLTKSVPANFSVNRASSLRSSVRSSKEIRKAAVAVVSSEKKHAADLGRMTGTRSVRRI